MTTHFALNLPERRTRYRFALTPLADAMFQLLIFFMLSSGLSAYALLDLRTAPTASDAPAGTASTTTAPASPQAGETALWTVEANALRVGGQRFSFDGLAALSASLGAQDTPASVVLIVRPSAQVQDIATVLASLSAANVTSVQVTSGQEF